MRMADETLCVNQARLFFLSRRSDQTLASRAICAAPGTARMQLAKELPGPIEEGAELIRIRYKINNERNRGQHEDRVSHGIYPAPTC
jgi:hypothetical protein